MTIDEALAWADKTMNERLFEARRTGTDHDYDAAMEACIDTLAAEVRRLRRVCTECGSDDMSFAICGKCEAALRQQAADMERGVADVLNGAIGEQDTGVVAGVELLAERYAALRERHAESLATIDSMSGELVRWRERHAEAVEAAFREAWAWLGQEPYCETADDEWLASEAKARLI